ncbi:MAG: hypothetical protein MUC47_09645 [Candidatus Kapabacteria bacterium]|nr:hypothetical protein [Candidatus Kapabacteria bacterium]
MEVAVYQTVLSLLKKTSRIAARISSMVWRCQKLHAEWESLVLIPEYGSAGYLRPIKAVLPTTASWKKPPDTLRHRGDECFHGGSVTTARLHETRLSVP